MARSELSELENSPRKRVVYPTAVEKELKKEKENVLPVSMRCGANFPSESS